MAVIVTKFNVGDIVIGNDLADKMYSVTCKGTLWEVIKCTGDRVSVCNTEKGEYNLLEPEAFDLYKPVDYKFKQGDKVKIAPNVSESNMYNDTTLLDCMIFEGVKEISNVVPEGYYVDGFCYSGAMLIPNHPVTSSQDAFSPRFCTGDTATLIDCNGNSIKVVITQGLNEEGCFIKQVSEEIEIDDNVGITDVGEAYTTGVTLFKEIIKESDIEESAALELAFIFAYGRTPDPMYTYVVKGKTYRPSGPVYLIEGNGQTFIIGEKGVKKVNG